MRKLNGSFEGRFTHVPSEPVRVDQLTLDMNFFMQDEKLQGNVQITMTDPAGKTYSRSNSDGSNRTLRLVPGRKDQIYIEPSPGAFILLDLRNEHHLKGRFYDDRGAFKGLVELWRKR